MLFYKNGVDERGSRFVPLNSKVINGIIRVRTIHMQHLLSTLVKDSCLDLFQHSPSCRFMFKCSYRVTWRLTGKSWRDVSFFSLHFLPLIFFFLFFSFRVLKFKHCDLGVVEKTKTRTQQKGAWNTHNLNNELRTIGLKPPLSAVENIGIRSWMHLNVQLQEDLGSGLHWCYQKKNWLFFLKPRRNR